MAATVRKWAVEEKAAVEQKAAAMEKAAVTEMAARQQATSLGAMSPEGLLPGQPGAVFMFMGGFALTQPPELVNWRAVWQAAGRDDLYAFVRKEGKWWIGRGESLHDRQSGGCKIVAAGLHGWVASVAAEPDALTPDQVKRGW